MNEAENLIRLYQTCFMVCLVFAAFFLILTVFMFFRFRIRKIIASRTGRTQKKVIEQMREENQRTGRLRHARKVAMGEYTPISLNSKNPSGQIGSQDERTESLPVSGQTEPMGYAASEDTMHLSEQQQASFHGKFSMVREVMLIHTNELI